MTLSRKVSRPPKTESNFILIKKNDDEAVVSGQTRTFLSKDVEGSSVLELSRKDQRQGTEITTTQTGTPSTASPTTDASQFMERTEEPRPQPRHTKQQNTEVNGGEEHIEKQWNVTMASEK